MEYSIWHVMVDNVWQIVHGIVWCSLKGIQKPWDPGRLCGLRCLLVSLTSKLSGLWPVEVALTGLWC